MRGPPFLVGARWHHSGQIAFVGYGVGKLSKRRFTIRGIVAPFRLGGFETLTTLLPNGVGM